jgi:hypothetical protein
VSNLHVVDSNSDDLTAFLDYLYSGLEGYTYSATKEQSGQYNQHFFEWPDDRDNLVAHIKANGNEREVYLAPAIFDAPVALGSHVKATNVLWAEFDGNTPSSLPDEIPPPTLRLQSSNPGHEHWYWKLNEALTSVEAIEAANRALTYALSADTSGWDANQVLRPPGTLNHKRGGLPVTVTETSDATYPFVGFSSVPAAPEQLAEITEGTIPDIADVILKYPWPADAIKVFRMTSDTVPTGDGRGRNVALVHLGYHCAEMNMSDVEMFSVLRNADDRWGKYKDRNDRNKRLTSIIERVRVKYPSLVYDEDVIPVMGFQSLMDTEIEIEWVIEGLLQEQGYMLFTGPSGVGKTQVSIRLAMHMALGKNYLEYVIDRPRKVLFFSLEMGHPDFKFFLQMMQEGLTDDERNLLERNFIVVPYGEPLYLDSERGKAQFEAIIKDVEPEGVFIDSVGSTTTGSISDEGTVKKIVDYNDHLRKKYSVFTWWIHHMRKAQADNKKPNKLSDVYGNQYLVNRATSVYCLWPKGTKIEVIPLKKRLAKLEDPWDIQRLVNLDFMKVSDISFNETPKLEYKAPETPFKSDIEKKSNDLMGGM